MRHSRTRRVPTTNWAGNQTCRPTEVHLPRSTAEVAAIVARAHGAGQRVKAIASAHSFTDIAMTDGHLISLDRMRQVVHVDGFDVTVQAGIRLRDLNVYLAALGLALPNLGDIAEQSIAGATATATHGTGAARGNISTRIVAIELVAGDGTVVRADEHHDRDLLQIARVSLGALGILTEVTLRCVGAFNLHAVETIEVLDDVLADFDAVMTSTDHVEFFLMPGARRCQVKRNSVTTAKAAPPSRWANVRDKWIGENLAFGAVCRVGRRMPALAPRVAGLVMSAATERDLIDRSDKVFTSPRHVRFTEMEYGIPFEAVPEALDRVIGLVASLPVKPMFPIEVRCSAADDIALSTGFGRASGWIAVHQYVGVPFDAYFMGVESIMDDYGGRPHWGKLHFQRAATLRDRYPEWDSFQGVRQRLDPDGTFRNAYLDRVLGGVDPA